MYEVQYQYECPYCHHVSNLTVDFAFESTSTKREVVNCYFCNHFGVAEIKLKVFVIEQAILLEAINYAHEHPETTSQP